MGEIADAMLDGTLCEGCGSYIGDATGYPGYCSSQCARDRGAEVRDERPALDWLKIRKAGQLARIVDFVKRQSVNTYSGPRPDRKGNMIILSLTIAEYIAGVAPVHNGRADYEADVRQRPTYHDGSPRKTWGQLGEIERWSWNRAPQTAAPVTGVSVTRAHHRQPLCLSGDHRRPGKPSTAHDSQFHTPQQAPSRPEMHRGNHRDLGRNLPRNLSEDGSAVMKPLSATMVACLDDAQENGGELVRYQGGYWADRAGGHPLTNRRAYHGATTVQALVARGYAEYSEHRLGSAGREFPIAMRVKEQSS